MDQVDRTNRLYADLHATLRNGLFEQKVPWIADDFLKPGAREERLAQRQRDRAETFKFTALADKTENVPDWVQELARQQGKAN